jgi:hypothetical protein
MEDSSRRSRFVLVSPFPLLRQPVHRGQRADLDGPPGHRRLLLEHAGLRQFLDHHGVALDGVAPRVCEVQVLERRPRPLAPGFGVFCRITDYLDLRWRDVLGHAEQLAHLVPPSGQELRPSISQAEMFSPLRRMDSFLRPL